MVYWEPITTPDFGYKMGALKPCGDRQFMANDGMKAFGKNYKIKRINFLKLRKLRKLRKLKDISQSSPAP